MHPDVISGRYRVIRPIGRGGMGTVWLCHDDVLNREVAVKQMGALPGEDTESTTRAMREARVTAAMNHESAVSVYDVVDHDGGTWLVMEYLPSQTLAELIASEGRLEPPRVADIGAQVAAALASAHDLGIVHRDIKPGNILVGERDVAKISDFGIARGHTDISLTQTGLMTGTPGYFSPELARGDDPSFASDSWALGVTLFTATEGQPPFPTQANPLAMLSMITREETPRPEHAGPLAPVIAALMERDPSQRWSMEQARVALREVAEGGHPTSAALALGAVGAPPVGKAGYSDDAGVVGGGPEAGWTSTWDATPETSPETSPPERSRRGGWWIAALGLLVLIGVGAAAWSVFGPDGNNNQQDANNNSNSGPGNSGQQDANNNSNSGPGNSGQQDADTADDDNSGPSDDQASGGSRAQAESFVSDYFTLVPGDLEAGWAALSPDFQASMGRDSYDGFWSSIESVDVSNVNAVSPTVVDYTISYDGSTPENKQITLVRDGSSYLISGDSSQS